MTNFDLIIIGAGPGGYQYAAEAAHKGQSVLLVEKGLLGGTCLNRGCIPTKCLLASAEIAHSVENAVAFGVETCEAPKMHFDIAANRMRNVVGQIRASVENLLKDVTVIQGEAALSKDSESKPIVKVNGEEYSAPKIVIATGSKPASLPIPGADLALTSDDVLSLESLPASVIIVGAGVIGMEFACILNAFGCEVTVIEFCPEILPPFDPEVAKRLRSMLSRRGIKIIVGAAVQEIALDHTGVIKVRYASKKGEITLEAQACIMAVGRKPVVPEGAQEIGIAINKRGFIEVDAAMATSVPGIYAVGDVNGKCMLAHAAEAQARVVSGEDVDLNTIPSAVFSIPECAMAGPTEKQCADAGIEYGSAKSMYAANGKALSMGQGDGFVKVLFERSTGKLLAVHIIGAHASDIAAEATACIDMGATVMDVATRFVHGHPTISEMFSAACTNALLQMTQKG